MDDLRYRSSQRLVRDYLKREASITYKTLTNGDVLLDGRVVVSHTNNTINGKEIAKGVRELENSK